MENLPVGNCQGVWRTHSLAGPKALVKVWLCLMLSFPLPPQLQETVKISLKTPKQILLPVVVFGEKSLELL